MSPLFSIITVCYNASNVIKTTLESVCEQTCSDYEYIIIDGASKDGTLEIIREYNNCVTKLVSEPDRGIYDAMNKGLASASGDYLIFLNAGDRFHSTTTLFDVKSKLCGDEDVIYGETAIVNGKGEFLSMRRLKAPEKLDWKSFKKGMLVCHQSFWAKRDIAKNCLYDLKYRYSSDVDWCIRIMKRSDFIFNSNEVLIDYLNEGMTTGNRWKSLKERFVVLSRHYGLFVSSFYHLWFVIRALKK